MRTFIGGYRKLNKNGTNLTPLTKNDNHRAIKDVEIRLELSRRVLTELQHLIADT